MAPTDLRDSTQAESPEPGGRRGGDADPVRVLLACDDPFSREAFRAAAEAPGVVLAAAGSVAESVANLFASGPADLHGRYDADDERHPLEVDVIVLDAQMPALSALEALARVRRARPEASVLVFSDPPSEEFGLLCLSLGASGYLSKDIDLASLPRILQRVGDGEVVFSRQLGTALVDRLREREGRRSPVPPGRISGPERQLLELLKSGPGLEAAANELGISLNTVRRHLSSARRKLAGAAVARAGTAERWS